MRKFTVLFFSLLLATVGAWAQTATTEWIDYTGTFNGGEWTNKDGNAPNPWGCKVVSTAPSPYTVKVTLETADGDDHMGYASIASDGETEKLKRPWLTGSYSYKISVPDGYKIAAYEAGLCFLATPPANTDQNTYTYTVADGTATSGKQTTEVKKITVTGLNTQEIVLDLSNITKKGFNHPTGDANALLLYNLKLKLSVDNINNLNTHFAEVIINVQNSGEDNAQYTEDLILPVRETPITLKNYVPEFSFVTYNDETGTVQSGKNTFTLTYNVDEAGERAFPFATSYEALTTENKWVSMLTKNDRMHVYDSESEGNVYNIYEGSDGITYTVRSSTRKYPTIDKATFTRLNGGFFWGFVREGRFKPTYIVNKGAGEGQYLYLKVDGNDKPLWCADSDGNGLASKVTNEWVIKKGQTVDENGQTIQYYGVKAVGTSRYINNFNNNGYMTTFSNGPGAAKDDNGSNIRFIPELETYEILKERALNAPYGAVHSLDDASRDLVKGIDKTQISVNKYNDIIKQINEKGNGSGFIEFVDGGYYYLRNYTPASSNNVYVLGSDNGTSACTFTVPSAENNNEAGDADNPMTYSNINAIWQISTAVNGEAPGTGIGASRTVAREVTHVNSAKKLTAAGSRNLTDTGDKYYFVELGAGQHFMKNTQYNGSGQQASCMPLSCQDNGTLYQKTSGVHSKNSRDTWYGIPVTSIDVEIGQTGYATLYLPFGVDLPATDNTEDNTEEALKAYAVTAAGNGVATLTEVTCIPANEGVILKGKAGKKYTLTINSAAAWTDIDNKLSGSNMHENINVDAYVLSQPTGKEIGLYKAEKNLSGSSWLNNDNKAYLPASAITDGATGAARFLSFDFGTETGLDVISSGVESASTEPVVYDLSGRRVRNAWKGMYIVDGKKIIK